MSSKWCNWCTLSAKEWSLQGHGHGEMWTLEMLHNIRNQVECNNMPETPQNLRGVTERPLIDSVPVSNYILCILHIIIGMGNTFIDAILEWIEERIEQLDVSQIQARNGLIYATTQHDLALTDYESWLENDGILLNDKELEKRQLKLALNDRVQ
jgi:hypothetical protein